MATVQRFLPSTAEFYKELQERDDYANSARRRRFLAVVLLQKMTRGYLIRKYLAFLAFKATIIQCAFRQHRARRAYRAALKRAVQKKHGNHYATAATAIQAWWQGYISRRDKFCYRSYRRWLATVTQRGERLAAEAAEFGIRTRADDLSILEIEARQWLAYVVFKLHHLLRTYNVAGIYSDAGTTELSEFEKLLKSIQYTEYTRRLKRKYDEFVKKHKPQFTNKKLFPIIGEGNDYWYMSLPEMYELSRNIQPMNEYTRHRGSYHGKIHKQPFLWRSVRPPCHIEGRGPFTPPRSPKPVKLPVTPAPSASSNAGSGDSQHHKDPRFCLYVKYYRPRPDLMDYIDFHINVLLRHQCSIENIEIANVPVKSCRPKKFNVEKK